MVSFTRTVTAKTASKTSILPKLEAITSDHLLNKSVAKNPPSPEAPIIKSATPRLAPLLMPNTKGPAKGLRKSVCIKSPLMESPAPTIMAVSALGNR